MEREPAGCLAAVLRYLGIRLPRSENVASSTSLPYRLTQQFLSAAELSFYKVAVLALPDGHVIVSKPRIADILFVPRGSQGRWAFENKIRSKHVDFLVCDSQTMRPRLIIELDDKSHDRSDRQERDNFVDQAFAAAGLEVIHVRARTSYVLTEVRTLVHEKLKDSKANSPVAVRTVGVPECSNCRVSMVQRTAAKGSNKGATFWGCPNYPKCRMTSAVEG